MKCRHNDIYARHEKKKKKTKREKFERNLSDKRGNLSKGGGGKRRKRGGFGGLAGGARGRKNTGPRLKSRRAERQSWMRQQRERIKTSGG